MLFQYLMVMFPLDCTSKQTIRSLTNSSTLAYDEGMSPTSIYFKNFNVEGEELRFAECAKNLGI